MRSLAAAVNLSEDTHPTRSASWLETLDFALSYEMVAEMQFSVVNLTHEVGTLIGGKGLCQCIGKLQFNLDCKIEGNLFMRLFAGVGSNWLLNQLGQV